MEEKQNKISSFQSSIKSFKIVPMFNIKDELIIHPSGKEEFQTNDTISGHKHIFNCPLLTSVVEEIAKNIQPFTWKTNDSTQLSSIHKDSNLFGQLKLFTVWKPQQYTPDESFTTHSRKPLHFSIASYPTS